VGWEQTASRNICIILETFTTDHGSLANRVLIGETDLRLSEIGGSTVWEFRGIKKAEIDVRPERDDGGQGMPEEIDPDNAEQPAYRFALHQNHPNPFNPATIITYEIQESAHVRLRIFDVRGRLVRTLEDSDMPAGMHDAVWDGMDETGRQAVSGIYFYRLKAGSFEETRKMVILR
jgi:hypothetical protein